MRLRKIISVRAIAAVVVCAAAALPQNASAVPVVRSGAGANPASIEPAREAFRADLGGGLVPGANGSFGSVRREINWDGTPDNFSSPNDLPPDFFNVNSPRGVVFSTPGTALRVSADSANPTSTPPEFEDIQAEYRDFFDPFSPQRLFTALGSNIVDVHFFVPGTSTPALTSGFGAIFSDVDFADTTSIAYFDAANALLGTFFVPAPPGFGSQTFPFLGVSFGSPLVSRVRITSGDEILEPGNVVADLVVMDDFLYGEPTPQADVVPEPASMALLTAAIGGAGILRRRRK